MHVINFLFFVFLPLIYLLLQGGKVLSPETRRVKIIFPLLQNSIYTHRTLILDNGHGCLSILHLGEIIWKDEIIMKGLIYPVIVMLLV